MEVEDDAHEDRQKVQRRDAEEVEIDRREIEEAIGLRKIGEEEPTVERLENPEECRLLAQLKREVEHGVERHPNRHLREGRKNAADATRGAHAAFLKEAPLLLLHALRIVFELLLQLVEFGLECRHRLGEALHRDLRLLLNRVQDQAHNHDERDDRKTPVKHDVRLQEEQEPQQSIGEPREGAPRAATAHEIHDEVAHVERSKRLSVAEDAIVEGARVEAEIKRGVALRRNGNLRAPKGGEEQFARTGQLVGERGNFSDTRERL